MIFLEVLIADFSDIPKSRKWERGECICVMIFCRQECSFSKNYLRMWGTALSADVLRNVFRKAHFFEVIFLMQIERDQLEFSISSSCVCGEGIWEGLRPSRNNWCEFFRRFYIKKVNLLFFTSVLRRVMAMISSLNMRIILSF